VISHQETAVEKDRKSFLVGGAITILKNMSSSMGRMTSHILWKIIQMIETTKQTWIHMIIYTYIQISHSINIKYIPKTHGSLLKSPKTAGDFSKKLRKFHQKPAVSLLVIIIPSKPGRF
jgi:hypothetical protein